MATVIGMAEFLEKVSKLKKKDEKVAALRHNDSFQLRTTLQGIFDPNIRFLLPEGEVPFKPNDLPDQESVYLRECRKLAYYVQGGSPVRNQTQREMMFIQLLENLDKRDAVMMVYMKDKKSPWKGITYDIVREAFPDMLPPESQIK